MSLLHTFLHSLVSFLPSPPPPLQPSPLHAWSPILLQPLVLCSHWGSLLQFPIPSFDAHFESNNPSCLVRVSSQNIQEKPSQFLFFTSSKPLHYFESQEQWFSNCLIPRVVFLCELCYLPRQKARFSFSKNYIMPSFIIFIRTVIDNIY